MSRSPSDCDAVVAASRRSASSELHAVSASSSTSAIRNRERGTGPPSQASQAAAGQAGLETAVIRWMAKVREESLRSSYAVTRPPSTRSGLTRRSATVPSLPT